MGMLYNFQKAADQMILCIPAAIAVGVQDDYFFFTDQGLVGRKAGIPMRVGFDFCQLTDEGSVWGITVGTMGMNNIVCCAANDLVFTAVT